MINSRLKSFSWDFYSKLIIMAFCLLQIFRWRIVPQFVDIYYHLLTADGFIRAGGYSGWDFMQYAPYGRAHIYPPFFHLILAFLMKSGVNSLILAKLFETVLPIAFLIVLWYFIKKNYDACLAFFVMLAAGSSFSFYMSLMNHVPATLALILGIISIDRMFKDRPLKAGILLALCLYTHIGVSWFFVFTFLCYGLMHREKAKKCIRILLYAFLLSIPMLVKEFASLKYVQTLGVNLNEVNSSQIKIADYLLAFLGIFFISKMGQSNYRLFLSLFLGSLMFITYPYRLLSAEGYMPIIFLSATALYSLYGKFKKKYLFGVIVFFILFISPTIKFEKPPGANNINLKLDFSDSAFLGMQLARSQSVWFPKHYLSASEIIKNNSQPGDIIYSSLDVMGVTLAALSERATSCALLPEIKSSRRFDPIVSSKVIIFLKDDDKREINRIASFYKLEKIGENGIFFFYRNTLSPANVGVNKASLSFGGIILILFVMSWLYCQDRFVEKNFKNFLTKTKNML